MIYIKKIELSKNNATLHTLSGTTKIYIITIPKDLGDGIYDMIDSDPELLLTLLTSETDKKFEWWVIGPGLFEFLREVNDIPHNPTSQVEWPGIFEDIFKKKKI